MSDLTVRDQFRSVALWCRAQQKGILTPTGKPKKPPTYWIVRCPDCGTGLTSSTEVTYESVEEDRVECKKRVKNEVVWTRRNWMMKYQKSKVCGQPVTVIETIGEADDV